MGTEIIWGILSSSAMCGYANVTLATLFLRSTKSKTTKISLALAHPPHYSYERRSHLPVHLPNPLAHRYRSQTMGLSGLLAGSMLFSGVAFIASVLALILPMWLITRKELHNKLCW